MRSLIAVALHLFARYGSNLDNPALRVKCLVSLDLRFVILLERRKRSNNSSFPYGQLENYTFVFIRKRIHEIRNFL